MKYLNGVLSVIAFCLVVITFAVTGLIPSAQAKNTNPNRISVPLNPDGSISVKFVKGETIDVNLDEINGSNLSSSTLDVNIDEVRGHSALINPLPVTVQR